MHRIEVKFQGKWYKVKRHILKGVYKLLLDEMVVVFARESAIENVRVISNEN